MTLKRVLKSLDEAPEAVRGFYKQVGDEFVLQVDGKDVEDVTALKNAKEHEKNLRVAAERERDEARGQVTAVTSERDAAIRERDEANAAKGTDVASLEASWSQKVEAAKAEKQALEQELSSEINRLLVDSAATRLATEISTVPELFAESVVAKRLKVEKGADGKFFARVLDKDGNPSAMTLDELKQELLASEKYAAIIISGKGSGGGAGGSSQGGGATQEKKFYDYSDEELVVLRRDNPTLFQKLRDEAQG